MKLSAILIVALFGAISLQLNKVTKADIALAMVLPSTQALNMQPEPSSEALSVTAGWEDFPNLHPLIVHFPIVLLVIAAFFQIGGFFVFKKEISWMVLIIVVLGFLGAYIAGRFVHPHTHELTEQATKVLEEHELYANWTIWLSGIAVVLKIGSHFLLKQKIWAEMIVAAVLLASAYTVSMAGHHGAQLVHIEGVGPQGNYLETEEHTH
jgi:uncharacterized membrane protein